MKEYGGYIELDTCRGPEFYPDLLALNSGRTALRFCIRYRGIKKLYIPFFCCSTVREACEKEQIPFEYYRIDRNFKPLPDREPDEGEWLYLVNFYGTLTDQEILALSARFPRMIADYTHCFFRRPLPGIDTLYSCRKFFGVADGAYFAPKEGSPAPSALLSAWQALPEDVSYDRMHFLLGRFEAPASAFYSEYAANNERFTEEPVKRMSKLTHNLLRAVDYSFAEKRRTDNFAFLHERLEIKNRLTLSPIAGAYAYPFWYDENRIPGAVIRRRLIEHKIYIPVLWPEVLELCPEETAEYQMAQNILPLPVDQRYTAADMEEILEILSASWQE